MSSLGSKLLGPIENDREHRANRIIDHFPDFVAISGHFGR